MKIGIIGAGAVGGNLAQLLVRQGHDVAIANSRGPATLTEVAARTGARPCALVEVAQGAEAVIVAIPLRALAELPAGLLDDAEPGAFVVDTNNYYRPRDGRIDGVDDGQASSRWVQELLGRPVVKAFNTIFAHHLLDRSAPPSTEGRRALPVAGDDAAIKQIVLDLVDEIGFDAVDVGRLDDSWRFQPGTPAYGPDVDATKLVQLLSEADAAG
jgi:predicted dinucleotide-binding enzyme